MKKYFFISNYFGRVWYNLLNSMRVMLSDLLRGHIIFLFYHSHFQHLNLHCNFWVVFAFLTWKVQESIHRPESLYLCPG